MQYPILLPPNVLAPDVERLVCSGKCIRMIGTWYLSAEAGGIAAVSPSAVFCVNPAGIPMRSFRIP